MSAPTERHETRALLRAHLAAASGYRHLTRHCPICHRLLRLAMEPLTAPQGPHRTERAADRAAEPPPPPEAASGASGRSDAPEAPAAEGDTAGTDRRTHDREPLPGDGSPSAT
ncbi:DUF6274 family protein [Streptomyces sp. NPDC102451]|uniref:DUF6274 family protein n=1 Tax=Streptomyces sp. NPDC102451 TaxID=3366177 RepID=UPI00380430BA